MQPIEIQENLVKTIRNALATFFMHSPMVVCKYFGQDNMTVVVEEAYPWKCVVTHSMWKQSKEYKKGVSFEDFVIGNVKESYKEMLLKSKHVDTPVDTPVDKHVSVTKFRESVDTDSLRKYIQATLNLDDSWKNRIEFVFHKREFIEVIVGDVPFMISKECFDNHLEGNFTHPQPSFEEFIASQFAIYYLFIMDRLKGNTMEHSIDYLGANERIPSMVPPVVHPTERHITQRPPFVIKPQSDTDEFIQDMNYFVQKINVGKTLVRLNQLRELVNAECTRMLDEESKR